MRFGLYIGATATALLATGCAVAPHGGGTSVTHDVANYLRREWPLDGPPVIPPDARQSSCSCCGGGSSAVTIQHDDWDQAGCLPVAEGHYQDPLPAVPLEADAPGRFFPVPVQPPFATQGPAGVLPGPTRAVIGPNVKPAG